MIEYETFIYLDVNRTGSGQVIDVMEKVCEERMLQRRRHAPITSGRLMANPRRKLVFATVRNPWDWYVSLWAWGVGGQSAVRRWLHASMPRKEVRRLYRPAEPSAFRRWLLAMHDPAFADRHMQERYPQSGLSPFMGFYTYRFQRVTTTYPRVFLRRWRIGGPEAVGPFHARRKAYAAVLRSETLTADLRRFVAANRDRCRFRPEAEALIDASDRERVHSSGRPLQGYRDYYDEETRELVASRDRFFLDEFGYRF
jgi:hypothetical protein